MHVVPVGKRWASNQDWYRLRHNSRLLGKGTHRMPLSVNSDDIGALVPGYEPFEPPQHDADLLAFLSQTPGPLAAAAAQVIVDSIPAVPLGLFPGVIDLTKRMVDGEGTYNNKFARPYPQKHVILKGVVLHRTGSRTEQSTIVEAYDKRVKNHSHLGAHYLVSEIGRVSLIVELNHQMAHAAAANGPDYNPVSIGIEIVGYPHQFKQPTSASNTSLENQIKNLNLSPAFKSRLLDYSHAELKQIIKNSDNGWIYLDINAEQRRSVWCLIQLLLAAYDNLDISSLSINGKGEQALAIHVPLENPAMGVHYSPDKFPSFSAHEHICPKTLGEGESSIEFIRSMSEYLNLLNKLEKLLSQLQGTGGDPAQAQALSTAIKKELETRGAIKNDSLLNVSQAVTQSNNDALLNDFYTQFYDRVDELRRTARSFLGD